MRIEFKKIKWKNFLSYGNSFTEIELNSHRSTIGIGMNGAGKSTLLDAICFALFGKSFRGVNKPKLINSVNKVNGVVELEFSNGVNEYKIVRGLKPNAFEIYCNNVLLNQDSKTKDYQDYLERTILKLNYKSFTQIVILGSSSFTPFMQLTPGDRRSIIEDLLDIEIFSHMREVSRDILNTLKDEITSTKSEIAMIEEKIKIHNQNLEEHKKYNDTEIKRKNDDLDSFVLQSDKLTKEIDKYKGIIDKLQKSILDKQTTNIKFQKLLQFETKLESGIRKIKNDITFFESHDICPTCKQPIDEDFKTNTIGEKHVKNNKILDGLNLLKVEMDKLKKRSSEISDINDQIVSANNGIIRRNSTIKSNNAIIAKIFMEIQNLTKKKGSLIDDSILKESELKLSKTLEHYKKLLHDRQHHDVAQDYLKDTGIKTKIIKQYVPMMNKLINKYLQAMDFFVEFNLDENFNETIKSRYRDDFTYTNFSEGEKQRLNIAIMLAWRQISKLKNSCNTNLLILDEIFDSSLDGSSVELLMDLLGEISKDTNIFVISHRGDQMVDKFERVLTFNKKGNFSYVEK